MVDRTAIRIMRGQLSVSPCFWCGGGSEGMLILSEPRRRKNAAGKEIWVGGQRVPACAKHLAIGLEKPSVEKKRIQAEKLF
jgi:hypothetical protein